MRSDDAYNLVFSDRIPIAVYPVVAEVLKVTDLLFERFRPRSGVGGERFLKRWRQITSLITISRLFGKYDFSAQELSQLDISRYTDAEVEKTWSFIENSRSSDVLDKKLKGKRFFIDICKEASDTFSISNPNRIEKAKEFGAYTENSRYSERRWNRAIDMNFALKMNDLLPDQPWKRGVHHTITRELECSDRDYFEAVQILIDEGIRNKQTDGVVYDGEANVLCFDPERVNPETMQLN